MQKTPIYTSLDLADLLESWSTFGDARDTSNQATFHIAHPAAMESAGAQAGPAELA